MGIYSVQRKIFLVGAFFLIAACADEPGDVDPSASTTDSSPNPVTAENYVQAETDWNFAAQLAQAPINTWTHNDRVTEDNQTIIRSNVDVMYSLALVDVSEGATFSIPKRENGALQLIHYIDENGVSTARADDAAFFLQLGLRKRGYEKANVTWRLPTANRIVLDVEEGEIFGLGEIISEGNEALSDVCRTSAVRRPTAAIVTLSVATSPAAPSSASHDMKAWGKSLLRRSLCKQKPMVNRLHRMGSASVAVAAATASTATMNAVLLVCLPTQGKSRPTRR